MKFMKLIVLSNGKILINQNIKVSKTLWKVTVVLPIFMKNIQNDKLSIKSMWFIRYILN